MVLLVGCGLLVAAGLYLRRARTRAQPGRYAGLFARNAIKYVFAGGAIGFCVLCLGYGALAAMQWHSDLHLRALGVYSISAFRIVPYLPIMIGPMAMIAGIVVDVLFYVAPARSRVGTARLLRLRLRSALEYARRQRPAFIVVAAHSQGTVIALDVLGSSTSNIEEPPVWLVTAGSPIDSLYQRFLGSRPENRSLFRRYRDSRALDKHLARGRLRGRRARTTRRAGNQLRNWRTHRILEAA